MTTFSINVALNSGLGPNGIGHKYCGLCYEECTVIMIWANFDRFIVFVADFNENLYSPNKHGRQQTISNKTKSNTYSTDKKTLEAHFKLNNFNSRMDDYGKCKMNHSTSRD